MTLDDLHSKWAWLATENKIREDRSPRLRRRRLGQKGVGRFAAHRLGHELLLRTRVARDPKVLQVRFDWDLLDSERELNEYEFPVQRKKPGALVFPSGSRLDVVRLRVAWTRRRMESLRSQLAHLIDPEATASDFKIMFYSPWPELNVPLENPLPGNETHRLEFEVDASGCEIVRIFRGGPETSQTVQRPAPVFGALRGRLRYFDQGLPPGERGRGGDPDADWNVGVRIFRDGCRVRPYGEPGPQGDWLQIYRTRYQAGSKFRLKVNLPRRKRADFQGRESSAP